MSDYIVYADSLIAPVYALGSTSVGPTVFTHDSIHSMVENPPLKVQHEYEYVTAGYVDNIVEREDGYYADVYVKSAYDDILVMDAGVRGLSVGVYADATYRTSDRITTVVTHAMLREVSLVRRPAFAAAKLSTRKVSYAD